jgi:hypothetical protein
MNKYPEILTGIGSKSIRMKNINFSQHILPHLIAVVAFLIITTFFFKPVVFDNKVLQQHDIDQWRGGAQELIEFREKTGEEGLWTNSMFSGMPAYFVNTLWSDKPVTVMKNIMSFWLPHPINNIFIAFISYYIMLLIFGVRPYLAIGGAVAFGLSSFNIIGLAAGHNARIGAIAFMPLVMAGVHTTFTRSRILGFGLTTMATALHLMESHLQITYYLLLILIIYGIVQLVYYFKNKNIKPLLIRTSICIAAALIAVSAYAGKFWSTWEYSKYSMRGPSELTVDTGEGEQEGGLEKEYAFQYSNGIFEPLTLMIPNILGGSSSNMLVQDETSEVLQALRTSNDPQQANQLARYTSAYWGSQPYTAPYYAGAIICFLFVIGILFAEKRYVIWLTIVAGLGIVLSWGDNFAVFNYFVFDYFPGYNKFRSVTFTIIMAIFALPLLGMIGLESLISTGWNNAIRKKVLIALAVTGGLCLFLVLISSLFSFTREGEEQLPRWFLNALRSDRQDLLISDVFRSFFFIVVSAGLIWFYKYNRLTVSATAAILSLLIIIDHWSVDKRYFGEENYRRAYSNNFTQMLPVDEAIMQDKDIHYRVYNLQGAWNEARTSYFHKSIGGYHGAKIRRYQDLYDHCLQDETSTLINNLRSGNRDMSQYGILNMLNARYLTFGQEKNNFIRNRSALGNAWLVKDVVPVTSADEELLKTCNINPAQQAVIDTTKFNLQKTSFNSSGTVTLTSYAPNELIYEADLANESLVVFSEIYYPGGWQATIDGEPAKIIRANFVLRALKVPAGEHKIVFSFKPDAYFIGNKITMAGSWLVLLSFTGSLVYSLFRNPAQRRPDHTDQ